MRHLAVWNISALVNLQVQTLNIKWSGAVNNFGLLRMFEYDFFIENFSDEYLVFSTIKDADFYPESSKLPKDIFECSTYASL